MVERTCIVAGCVKAVKARRWCSMHYDRWRFHGDVNWLPPKIRRRAPIEVRYWSKVDQSGGVDACWPWRGSRDKDGYAGGFWDGTYRPNGRPNYPRAARWAYRHFIGPIPEGHGVLHHCDNPPCMNFAHWFTGTNADNMADRDAKGRHGGWKTRGDANGSRLHPDRLLRGEANSMAKLTKGQVLEIRKRYALGGIYQRELAEEYGVVQPLISMIVLRKIWQHL